MNIGKRIVAVEPFVTGFFGNTVEQCFYPYDIDHPHRQLDEFTTVFMANRLALYKDYQSYTNNPSQRVPWLIELIAQYNAFNKGTCNNVLVNLISSPDYPVTIEEHSLIQYIFNLCSGKKYYAINTDKKLGVELKMEVAFYE